MSDLCHAAEWARQRQNEDDEAWIERLRHLFEEERRGIRLADLDAADVDLERVKALARRRQFSRSRF